MRKCKIAVIIINYNGNEDTMQCLESIERYCMCHCYSVILIDNASQHPIDDRELSRFKITIHYLKCPNNLGFSGGNNLAVDFIINNKLKFDYLLLLNNDTVIVDDSIDRLLTHLEEGEAEIGGLVNYYYDNPVEIWQAGSLIRASKLSGKERRDFNPSSYKLIYVDVVPGSSLLIKYDVVEKIGLFDDRYFAYYEEVDFCIRAKENGYRVAFLPNTKILHKVGRSSTSMLKHYLRTRNTLLFYSIHYKQYMILAYFRALLRTIKCIMKSKFDLKYINPFVKGITDYRHGFFHEGSMMNFK